MFCSVIYLLQRSAQCSSSLPYMREWEVRMVRLREACWGAKRKARGGAATWLLSSFLVYFLDEGCALSEATYLSQYRPSRLITGATSPLLSVPLYWSYVCSLSLSLCLYAGELYRKPCVYACVCLFLFVP